MQQMNGKQRLYVRTCIYGLEVSTLSWTEHVRLHVIVASGTRDGYCYLHLPFYALYRVDVSVPTVIDAYYEDFRILLRQRSPKRET